MRKWFTFGYVAVLWAVVVFGGAVIGCGAKQSPPGPKLEPAILASAQYTAQLEQIQKAMLSDLDQFVSLRTRILHASTGVLEPPFPLDLFRFVLMSCLNDENSQQMTVIDSLSCRPRYYEEFKDKLAELPDEIRQVRVEAAQEMLQQIDDLRVLQQGTRARIVQMPQMIRNGQSLLEDQRVELRRIQVDMERRRALYLAEDWDYIQDSLAELGRQLSRLEDAIEALTLSYPEWTPQLNAHITGLYMDLAGLRSTP